MNYGSEPADQVVRYSLEGAEFALRISGTAAKNFFIFAQAVLHDSKKTHGKTHLIRLLKEQKPLKFFTVDKDRMHDFARAAKAHGLLFCPIRDKMDPDHIEIAILQDDASKANRIIDKLQLAIVDTGTAELIDTVQQERGEPAPETERVQTEDGAVDFEIGADEEQFNMGFPQGSENASPSEPFSDSSKSLPTRSTGRRAKCSIPPCCRSMTGCGARKSSGGRKPSCKFPDLKTRPDECKSSSGLFCCSSSGQKRGKTMIVVECLYTSNEIEEETILREQQKRCLAAAASYGWAVRREVFEPLQLSARGMDDRTGIQTILDDVCNRRFDLLMIASMDRLSYDKEEVKAFLAEMDLNGISIFNVGSNTVTLASGWDLMAFIRQKSLKKWPTKEPAATRWPGC